jgi:hypothetical protein
MSISQKNLRQNNIKLSSRKSHSGNNRKVSQKEKDNGVHEVTNAGRSMPIVSLPELIITPIRELYRRFVCSETVSDFIKISDLLNQFLFAISATTTFSYVSAVRIKKVRILAPLTTQGTTVAVSLRPQGPDSSLNNFNSIPEQYLDTSTSIDIPAYIALTPSKDTPFGSWHQNINVNTSGPLLNINCPPGTTLDVLFEYIERNPVNGSLAPTYSYTTSAATVGVLYASPMCTGKFLPVGVNYIL